VLTGADGTAGGTVVHGTGPAALCRNWVFRLFNGFSSCAPETACLTRHGETIALCKHYIKVWRGDPGASLDAAASAAEDQWYSNLKLFRLRHHFCSGLSSCAVRMCSTSFAYATRHPPSDIPDPVPIYT